MANNRYGKRKKNKNTTWILIAGFFIVGLWLLLSIWKGINPLKVLNGFTDKEQDEYSQPISYDSLMTLYTNEQNLRLKLSKEVDAFQAHASEMTVNMESGTLNMRSAASTSAEVMHAIPTGKSVTVYYCKKDSSLLNEKMGTWCKINYLNNEGWVWSEYIN